MYIQQINHIDVDADFGFDVALPHPPRSNPLGDRVPTQVLEGLKKSFIYKALKKVLSPGIPDLRSYI